MKVLGISCHYHDASAALVIDGKVVASAAEERFTRQKHDPTFPWHSLRYCLKQAGIRSQELDFVAFHEDPATKLSRTLSTSLARFPFSLGTFLKSAKDVITGGFWVRSDIARGLEIPIERVLCTPHHMSHAAHSFMTSPFPEAAVLTLDAVGEWTSSAIFRGTWKDGRARLEPLDISPFPHSLGLVYSAFTAFLGFKVNDGECSTTALAAFGKPVYADQVRRILRVRGDGRHEVDLEWFDFRGDTDIPVTRKFLDAFGAPRAFNSPLAFDCLGGGAPPPADQQRYADVAASLQLVLEEAVVASARRAKQLSGLDVLCYGGGVALNCVANTKLGQSGLFRDIFIPPDPGDGGGAMGAALYVASVRGKAPGPQATFTPYFGAEASPGEFADLAGHLQPERWHQFSLLHPKPLKQEEVRRSEFASDAELVAWAAKQIAEGRIIGWCQGRFENGPRALGNRSILCHPGKLDTARRLSQRVKQRAPFRPYALSLTDRAATAVLEPVSGLTKPGRWMQAAYKIRSEAAPTLRAALHVDGTTRAQCVAQAENPLFFDLLTEVGKLTGTEAVLNTSFNEAGYPIVGSAVDAMMMFARTEIDAVVVGRTLVEKARAK